MAWDRRGQIACWGEGGSRARDKECKAGHVLRGEDTQVKIADVSEFFSFLS